MNAEQYLLGCLAEECAELAQAASKAVRFGLDVRWPGKPTVNREDIAAEFNDVLGVLELMEESCARFPGLFDRGDVLAKKNKLMAMMKYSRERGRLEKENV